RVRILDFEAFWRKTLHDGVMPGTAFEELKISLKPFSFPGAAAESEEFELVFKPDSGVWDGRYANNGWLQELPRPITKLTWDNAIFVSPATAARLNGANRPAYTGGEHGTVMSDVFELRVGDRSVRGPLFAVAGHADDSATVHLGYG